MIALDAFQRSNACNTAPAPRLNTYVQICVVVTSFDAFHPRQLQCQHLPLEKQQRRKRLVLRARCYACPRRQIAEESFDLCAAQLARVPQTVATDIPAYPVQVRLLCAQTVMLQTQTPANFVQQPGARRALLGFSYGGIGIYGRH